MDENKRTEDVSHCCKDRFNFYTVYGSQKYDNNGYLVEHQLKCQICGSIETWVYNRKIKEMVRRK